MVIINYRLLPHKKRKKKFFLETDLVRNSRWLPLQDNMLAWYSIGIWKRDFFNETTNFMEYKQWMNSHWIILYKMFILFVDQKSKLTFSGIFLRWSFDQKSKNNFLAMYPMRMHHFCRNCKIAWTHTVHV